MPLCSIRSSRSCWTGHDVLVEDNLIKEVSDRPIKVTADRTIDLKGKTLMPGLIDLHVHAIAIELNLAQQVAHSERAGDAALDAASARHAPARLHDRARCRRRRPCS